MSFHAQRATYVLHKISLSSQAFQQIINPLDWGWELSSVNGRHIPTPVWDTEENMQKVDIIRQSIMHKCACKKTACNPTKRQCKCVRNGNNCSLLCTCSGCKNVLPRTKETIISETESEMVCDSSESESDYSEIYEELEWQWQWPTYDFQWRVMMI